MAEGTKLATAYVQIMPSMGGIGNKIKEEFGAQGKAGGNSFVDSFKRILLGGAVVAAAKTVASSVTGIVKKSVSAFADYEQLVGGVETLFKNSAGTIEKYAENAYKTAGLSANAYMETVTGFSASLIQSLNGDTKKAAKVADMAISDMSDNANKMGSSMESIQNAYQGFAKQNYTMLDNLKLGYGGTKTEMERLLKDAAKISGTKFDISSFSDVAEAIHVIQQNMEITGTTAKEAEHTISGSIASTKSAWENLMAGLGNSNANISALVSNLINSAQNVVSNTLPIIKQVVISIPEAFDSIVQQIPGKMGNIIRTIVDTVKSGFNTAKETAVSVFGYFSDQFSWIYDAVVGDLTEAKNSIVGNFDIIKKTAKDCLETAKSIFEDVNGKVRDFVDWLHSGSAGAETFKAIIIAVTAAITAYKAVMIATEVATKAASVAQGLLNAAMNANPIGLVITAVTALVAAFTYLWNNCEGFRNFWINLWAGMKTTAKGVSDWFVQAWRDAYNSITSIFSKIGSFFSGIWNSIKTTFSNLGTAVGNSISYAVKSGINGVIALIEKRINSAIKIINGAINLINKIPGVNIGKVAELSFPRLAKGGILERGQVGFLEGSGAEAVVPLSENKKWISAVARDMDNALNGSYSAKVGEKLDRVIDTINRLAEAGWYLDGKTLVGGIAGRMDGAIGDQTVFARRGLA